jgi:hypothetical protein
LKLLLVRQLETRKVEDEDAGRHRDDGEGPEEDVASLDNEAREDRLEEAPPDLRPML